MFEIWHIWECSTWLACQTFDQMIRMSAVQWFKAQGCVASLNKKLCSKLSLFIQVYKCVLVTYGARGNPGRSSNTRSCFMLQKAG